MSNQQLNPQQAHDQPENLNLAMSSVPSFQSINSLNEARAQEQGEGDLQVVQSKSDRRINHEQILKMFNEQLEKEQREREEIEMKRRESVKNKAKVAPKAAVKKTSNEERRVGKEASSERMQALSEKSTRLKKRIEEHCRQYKSMYRPSIYDTKMQKFRFQCKQKLFFHLCFGLEQLKQLSPEQLSPAQQQLLPRNSYEVCRKLAFDIDLQLVRILNKSDKYEISREYKQQFQTLLNNLKDENNHELKRKLLTRALPPNRIAIAGEIEFFTTAKREEILEKQKRYIAEFTVENVLKPFNEDNEEIMDRPRDEGPREELPLLKPAKSAITNKYLQQSSLLQLEELLSENQLSKMMRRLQQDLQGRSRAMLISNFKEVFGV